jgi:hypothetical protein
VGVTEGDVDRAGATGGGVTGAMWYDVGGLVFGEGATFCFAVVVGAGSGAGEAFVAVVAAGSVVGVVVVAADEPPAARGGWRASAPTNGSAKTRPRTTRAAIALFVAWCFSAAGLIRALDANLLLRRATLTSSLAEVTPSQVEDRRVVVSKDRPE